MNEFIDNLKALVKNSLAGPNAKLSKELRVWQLKLQANYQKLLEASREKLQPLLGSPALVALQKKIPGPTITLQNFGFFVMLVAAACASTWVMKILQLSPPPSIDGVAPRGAALYSGADSSATSALFGRQPLAKNSVVVQGIVISGRDFSGSLTGFALFELDGKPTGPIAIGESFGKGLSLQSLSEDTATLRYAGEPVVLKLQTSKKNKSTGSSSPNSKTPVTADNINPSPAK